MSKSLIIAEKPSVAADIVKALPEKFKKLKNYFESDSYVVSYAVGHLVSIVFPEEIDSRFQKWSLDNLPIIPEEFPLTALPGTKSQLNALQKLIRRRDVTEIINACDAGREGELIFKYILKFTSTRTVRAKKVRRLWLQSMTREAIREGFASLRENGEMRPLEDTALCRSESDWLIGINATRAMTGYNSRNGGFRKTPCGRVQTPTLSLIVKRENIRLHFQPVAYWELHATFTAGEISYAGTWIDPGFRKDPANEHARKNRIWEEERAREIVEKCSGKPAAVTETSRKSTQRSPLLYDLTTLQREANSRFGFSAKNTLSIAQALYERHKVLTYPRTDSRNLPEDYISEARKIMGRQSGWKFGGFADQALAEKYIKPDRRIFNNARISDHFAIIPTTLLPKNLNPGEEKIYQLVVQRFIAVFYPAAVFHNTKRLSIVEEETFLTEGKILVEPGWKAVYGATVRSGGRETLAPLPKGAQVQCAEIEAREHATKPPPRYTEATLLSAMENSDKLLDDEELRNAMKERGLGTPATRAAIIEKLLNEKYIVREGKELAPTGKAFELLSLLEAMKIEELASPELTGEWEYKLNQILKGRMTREQFMKEIREMTRKIVEQVKGFRDDTPDNRREASFSPVGDMRIFETPTAYVSEDNKIMLRKVLGGRVMAEEEIVRLFKGETLGPWADFRSKRGKPFTASLRLKNNKIEFIFADSTENLDLEAIKKNPPLGRSPLDGTPVYETPAGYLSESALEGDRDKGLRFSKMILKRRIDPVHITQLLEKGKTELIKGFISKRKRPFDAYLLLDKKGKLTFEFPPRKSRKKK